MRIVIISFFIFMASISVSAGLIEREPRILNGRQYVMKLSQVLNVSMYDYRPLFETLKLNLPREGELSEFYVAKDSMAKLAGFGCDIMEFLEGPDLNIDSTYQRILGRKPTASEKEKAIYLSDGELDVFSTCLLLTMHPEFIYIKN